MNCNECTSQKVCFLQKQVENLANRTANEPFNDGVYDTDGDRTQKTLRQHERKMIKEAEICYKLKIVIASNCKLYLQKDQGVNGESSSIGQSTGL